MWRCENTSFEPKLLQGFGDFQGNRSLAIRASDMDNLKIILRVAKSSCEFPHLYKSLHVLSFYSPIFPVYAPLKDLLDIIHILIVPGYDVII